MNLIDLVERSAERLTRAAVSFGHGTDNAFDEAAWLVLWKLGLPLDALDEHASRAVSEAEAAAADALVQERITHRVPAAYLTGEAWLQGVPFFVDERVIVPRSLIAEPLADGTLDAWLSDGTRQVLDLSAFVKRVTAASASAPGVTLLPLPDEGRLWVLADSLLLEHVVLNLVANALDWAAKGQAAEPQVRLWLDMDHAQHTASFNVADSAISIGAVSLILDELRRVRSSK